jgi:predicted ATPase with chaperone activity
MSLRAASECGGKENREEFDFSEVKGQYYVRRAVEVAAAEIITY